MIEGKRLLHCGYFCHQVAEKSLKAMVANTSAFPPKVHDLQRLAKMAGVFEKLSDEQFSLIDRLAPLQIEARYPEYKEKIAGQISEVYCKKLIADTEEFLCWIKKQLKK